MKADYQDLWAGAQWLEWALDDYVDADEVNETGATSMADSIRRCIEYLRAESDRRENRTALAAAKREYAAEHGIKISQVRVKR